MKVKAIVVGKTYEFYHRRKGRFSARVVAVVDSEPGDLQDTQLIEVEIDTSPQTGNTQLQHFKGQLVRASRLRPSLIVHFQEPAPHVAPQDSKAPSMSAPAVQLKKAGWFREFIHKLTR